MKAALCVVSILAALSICCFKQAAPSQVGTITLQCCEQFKTTRIPHKRLKSYIETVGCPTPAVIFTNKKNMKICTKASAEWVKTAVKYLGRVQQGRRN